MIAALATAAQLPAQNALVLSGGAARGLAQVGALDRLRELAFDADLIVGTSIGAVVGALHAAGYEPADIEERILAVHWNEMFHPTPVVVGPDRALRVPALNFDLNVGVLRASRGLFGQWRVNRALADLLFEANARSRGDFDLLPRRFRAVAADLQTGDAVVLDSGDVARAVRASMAFPGFFAPVQWGERVLIDGGIVDNFPVSIARDLGAAYVVGVDVTAPPPEIGSPSPFKVIDRTIRLMQLNLERHDQPPDVLLAPIITDDFVGPSFPEDPRPLIRLGYEFAKRELTSFEPPPGDTARPRAPLPASFSRLRVEAADSALAALTRIAFGPVVAGPFDPAAVRAATDRLYTTGLFEAVWPRVVNATDTARDPVLLVRVEAPPRLSLTAAAHFENDRGGRAWASVDRQGKLFSLPTVFSATLTAGSIERWLAASVRMHLLTRSTLAWSIGGHVLERAVRSFQDDAITVKEVLRSGGWAGIEFPHVLRERLLTVVVRGEWIDTEDGRNGSAFGPLVRYTSIAAEARPVGLPFLFEAERRWGSFAYTRTTLRGSRTFGRRGPRLALGFDVRGVSSAAPQDVRAALGDEHAIPGLRWGEARGRARVIVAGDVALPVQSAFVRLRARTGAVSEELDEWDAARWVTGGQLGIFLPTPVGIVEAGYGVATRGDGRFDISIGRNF